MLTLFEHYPALNEKLSHVSLGSFPTPVKRMVHLENELGVSELYLKQDGYSGQPYGGNKVRKLEFILASALKKKARAVLTFGYAGSNHALATSVYAKKLGLKSTSILLKQPNAHYVRRNLLMGYASGAELCQYPSAYAAYLPVVLKLLKHKITTGGFPFIIPPGGSSPEGLLGHVNAAFELKNQIENRELPEPARIFVALGTMGTAAGLLLGLRAAGLKSKLVSVRVTDEKYGNPKKFRDLFEKTSALISSMDPDFPAVEITEEDFSIKDDFFGEQYARFTPEGMNAVNLLREKEDVSLEGTYTGKTMAAMLDHLRQEKPEKEAVLFWNTYNAVDFSDEIKHVDYRQLPSSFHCYFEEKVQPLDEP